MGNSENFQTVLRIFDVGLRILKDIEPHFCNIFKVTSSKFHRQCNVFAINHFEITQKYLVFSDHFKCFQNLQDKTNRFEKLTKTILLQRSKFLNCVEISKSFWIFFAFKTLP